MIMMKDKTSYFLNLFSYFTQPCKLEHQLTNPSGRMEITITTQQPDVSELSWEEKAVHGTPTQKVDINAHGRLQTAVLTPDL